MNKYIKIIGPGLLVAATGVGAGDLATSALAGSHIGLTAISAIVIGGVIKYFLNEGIARWQFHTSTTLLDGALSSFCKAISWMFLIYLIIWSYTVGVALISASGASFYAILPIFENPRAGKIIYGIVLSLLGYGLVKIGGFRVFEHVMSGAVVLMVMAVFYSVFQLDFRPSTAYSIVPSSEDITWYLAVVGGVGGTVTVLCYGYWVKESQRDLSKMTQTRIDLGISYFITVLLGVCMVLIGTKIQVSGGGSGLLINLSNQLDQEAGLVTGWVFRIGAFAAIFSSLLGVWQSVPYLFICCANLSQKPGFKLFRSKKATSPFVLEAIVVLLSSVVEVIETSSLFGLGRPSVSRRAVQYLWKSLSSPGADSQYKYLCFF